MSYATNIAFGPSATARVAAAVLPLVFRIADARADINATIPAGGANLLYIAWADGVVEADFTSASINHTFTGTTQKFFGFAPLGPTPNWGSITSIPLPNIGLVGSLNAEIAKMVNLTILNLNSNSLEGPLPADFYKLLNLERLELGGNSLSVGAISADIGDLVNLEYLGFQFCGVTDTLPPEIFTLTTLTELHLNGNSITDTLSVNIKNLVNLTTLSLGFNNFSGTIPLEIQQLPLLENLNIPANGFNNYLTGTLSGLAALKAVDFNQNSLTQANVDAVLADLVSSLSLPGRVKATVGLVANAAPSATGATDAATLRSAGWTVTHT